MAKLFQTPAIRAANHLYSNSGRQVNWLFSLADNRRGRVLKDVGVIPYERRSGKVFYNDRDIIAVAEAVKLNEMFGQPFTKLF